MNKIKKILILICSFILDILGIFIFKDIFYAKKIIIKYAINPFDICEKQPQLWNNIKLLFIFSYIISSIIISNNIFKIIKNIKENNENLSEVLKEINKTQNVIIDSNKSIIEISNTAKESIPQINEHFTNIDNRTKESTAYLQTLISENLNNIKSYLEKITEDVLSKTTQSIYENNRQFKYEISEHISQCKMLIYSLKDLIPDINEHLLSTQKRFNKKLIHFNEEVQNSLKENTYEINKQIQLLKETTANINNTLDDTISLSTKRLENITVATSNQIKTMAEEMEKLCVRKIEKLDNTLIEEFTDALSCLAGQLVTIIDY